jgi:NADH-quinone oxidoreductase subunit L
MDAETKHHLHESPKTMTVPLMILAVLSAVGGLVGIPGTWGIPNLFEEWLAPVMHGPAQAAAHHALASTEGSATEELTLMLISIVVVLAAIYAAYYFYKQNTSAATELAGKLKGVRTLLANKYYVDEIYGAVIIRPVIYFSVFLWKIFDVIIIDGTLNGLASLWAGVSDTVRFSQSGQLRGYATIFTIGVVIVLGYFMFR